MLDNRFGSCEHGCEDATFLVEAARPAWIVRHQQHLIRHRSIRSVKV